MNVNLNVYVDVIVPVHNAEETIKETVDSAMRQSIPSSLLNDDGDDHNCGNDDGDDNSGEQKDDENLKKQKYHHDGYSRYMLQNVHIDIAVCCYDDGSTDESLEILNSLKEQYSYHNKCKEVGNGNDNTNDNTNSRIYGYGSKVTTRLLVGQSKDKIARGAGYARNRAADLRLHAEQIQISNHDKNDSDNKNGNDDRNTITSNSFICLLDSDDIMHEHRIAEQLAVMLKMTPTQKHSTILGCTFSRIPKDSTWHYTNWANNLTDERLLLERFREVSVLQPTWFLSRARFEMLGGYIEAPLSADAPLTPQTPVSLPPSTLPLPSSQKHTNKVDNNNSISSKEQSNKKKEKIYKLIHPIYDNDQTLRLAEDLRFFHAHLNLNNNDDEEDNDSSSNGGVRGGSLKLIRTNKPLLQYRHRVGQSQSSSTSRKLLLQLRAKAFIDTILLRREIDVDTSTNTNMNIKWLYCNQNKTGGFVIWGAGRDGKDFFKSLPDEIKLSVRCFVDVDEKKIKSGYYISPIDISSISDQELNKNNFNSWFCKSKGKNGGSSIKIPIVHFSLLAKDDNKRKTLMNEWMYPSLSKFEEEEKGRIVKGDSSNQKGYKRIKLNERQEQQPQQEKEGYDKQLEPRKLHGLSKKDKANLQLLDALKDFPVVVCVAMYRSSGVLETNVANIGRQEGVDLWHFS
jgi:glycosyltransferase involved in cell wall biosynthesis